MHHRSVPISLLISSTMAIGCIPSIARGDAIPSGVSPVDYCFSIANLDRYPDYSFFSEVKGHGNNIFSLDSIDSQGCYRVEGYMASATVFAQAGQKMSSPSPTAKRIYDKSSINSLRYFEDNYNVSEVKDIVKIKSVSPTEIKLEYVETIYTLKDGKIDRQSYKSPEQRPLPGESTAMAFNILYLAVSLGAVGAVAIGYRKFNKGRKTSPTPTSEIDRADGED